jgi:hypothetical protein
LGIDALMPNNQRWSAPFDIGHKELPFQQIHFFSIAELDALLFLHGIQNRDNIRHNI